MNISRKPPPINNEGIIKINLTKTRELMRSISEVTNDDYFEDGNDRNNNNNNNNNTNVFFDLRQEYENAVHCLKSAESMMKSLQHHLLTKVEQIVTKDKQLAEKDAQLVAKDAQLAKRDAQLTSKDECIECLEKRMVQMSMELASTNMMKDELEYKLLKTSVVRSESEEEGGNKVSVGDDGDDDVAVATSDAMAARLAKYRPRSTYNNGKKRSSQIQEDDNNLHHRSSQNGNNNNNNNNSNSSSSCLGLQKPKPSLLVPFGHQRKSYVLDEKEKRTVRFSPMEGMRFYERPSEIDASRLFYGDDDYNTMKMERNEAVREYNILKHVSLTSCGNNGGDEGDTGDKAQQRRCTLTGIENVITRDVQENIWKRREECIRAVLEEEARQVKLLGGCGGGGRGGRGGGMQQKQKQQQQQQQQQRERDVERIANVSRLHSKHAVEMARRCANRQVVARSESVERC